VNVASRLSDLSGPDQIWANDAVIDQLAHTGIRYRSLGPISIRGKAEQMPVYRIEWEDGGSEFLTVQASLQNVVPKVAPKGLQLELSWLDVRRVYTPETLPVRLGRTAENEFVINDPRVSRTHARIEWRHGSVVLVDLSSYGTWLRFNGEGTAAIELALRREECVLHGSGEIGMGAPFNDFTAPIVTFQLTEGGKRVQVPASRPAPLRAR
jgi:hypothetical protein